MPIKLINVNIMSQLTSRGLDNTSSAFVSDIKDLARAPEIVPSIFYFFQFLFFFDFFLIFSIFFCQDCIYNHSM